MRIAIAQMNTRAGDFDRTVSRLVETSEAAAAQGAELLLVGLPTMTGNLPPEAGSMEGYFLDLHYAMGRLDQQLACPLLLPISAAADETYPELVLLGARGREMRLGTVTPESDGEQEGSAHMAWRLDAYGHRAAFAFVYEDLEYLADSNEDFDALIYITCYGYGLDDAGSAMGCSLEESRFREDVSYLGCWFVGVAGVGGYGTDVFDGASFVLNPAAELVAAAPAFEEALLVCDIDFGDDWEGEPTLQFAHYERYAHLWMSAALGVRDYLAKRDVADCCLVLDGSLGSSVLAVLAVDAVGPGHVRALVADDPEFADGAGSAAARELAASLRIEWVESGVVLDDTAGDVALYRDLVTAALAGLARRSHAVPFASTDKTALALEAREAALSVASLLPLGDVYRSDVLELAVYRNTVSPVIPAHCFRAYSVPEVEGLEELEIAPEMCVKYCDDALLSLVEWERNLNEVCARNGDEAVTTRIVHRFRDLESLRRQVAPVLRLSSRSLSDARMPLNNVWRPHVWLPEERLDYERIMRAPDMPLTQRAGLERLAREGLSEGVESLLEGLARDMGGLDAREGGPDVPDRPDPAEIERALGSVFSLLQDLAQSGTLTPPPTDSKEGPDLRGWEFPFSDN